MVPVDRVAVLYRATRNFEESDADEPAAARLHVQPDLPARGLDPVGAELAVLVSSHRREPRLRPCCPRDAALNQPGPSRVFVRILHAVVRDADAIGPQLDE